MPSGKWAGHFTTLLKYHIQLARPGYFHSLNINLEGLKLPSIDLGRQCQIILLALGVKHFTVMVKTCYFILFIFRSNVKRPEDKCTKPQLDDDSLRC